MASSTFTIEICDEDRRRIDALVDALKKSEGLSKLLEQRDPKYSVEIWRDHHFRGSPQSRVRSQLYQGLTLPPK